MKRLITLYLILFLSVENSFAQTNVIDSLKKVYENAQSDTAKLAALVKLQDILTVQDEQVVYLNKQLVLANKLQKIEMTADILRHLGWYKYSDGELSSADSFYRKSIAISQKYNYPRAEGAGYICLMMLYWWQGKTQEGVAYFEKAETILQKANANRELSSLYLNASELYKNINLFDQSLDYAKKSFYYANMSSDSSRIIESAGFLGDAYRIAGEDKMALSTLTTALQMAQRRKDEFNEGDIYRVLDIYYFQKGDYSKAAIYSSNALKLFSKLQRKDRILNEFDMLADIYFYKKDFVNSKKILYQKKQMISAGNIIPERYLYKRLANIDLINRDIDSWKINTAIADSLENLYTNSEVQKGVLEINTKYQTSLKEKQILLLEQQKSTQKILIISLLISLIILAVISFFIYRYINQKKLIIEQKNIQLEQEKQLVAVSSILEGQEAERSRMAKDLHDGLGGMLSGIKLNLSSMKGNMIIQETDAQLFTKSITQLDNAITEMRRVAHNMMPEALLKFGLGEAIQDYCDGINESNTVKMKFTQLGLQQTLEKSTEVILYRIVQELCNNAIKHATAENIFIQFTKHERGITLTVEDDGKGFDTTQLSTIKGDGLKNVQSRVDYLKGNVELQSSPGNGTSVIIEIPVSYE